MKQSKQHGFTVIEVIIVIGIVAIIGLLSYIAYNQLHGTKTAANTAPTTASTTPSTNDTATTNDNEATKTAVFQLTQKFYDAYYRPSTDGRSTTYQPDALQEYGTANAINNFGADEKKCMQNAPASADVSLVTNTASPFIVNVDYNYSDQEQPSVMYVTVVSSNGTYKIDSLTCDNPITEDQNF